MIKELLINIISTRQDSRLRWVLHTGWRLYDQRRGKMAEHMAFEFTLLIINYSTVIVLPRPPATTITCLHLIHFVDLLTCWPVKPISNSYPIGIVCHCEIITWSHLLTKKERPCGDTCARLFATEASSGRLISEFGPQSSIKNWRWHGRHFNLLSMPNTIN